MFCFAQSKHLFFAVSLEALLFFLFQVRLGPGNLYAEVLKPNACSYMYTLSVCWFIKVFNQQKEDEKKEIINIFQFQIYIISWTSRIYFVYYCKFPIQIKERKKICSITHMIMTVIYKYVHITRDFFKSYFFFFFFLASVTRSVLGF